jgi:uncharacterized protein (DUF433 family)
MSQTIWGVVQDGKIIPQTPLPDGLQVQITVPEEVLIPDDIQAELLGLSQGNAEALAMVESLSRDADDVIRVGGTRVTLDTVVGAYRDGASAEEIARRYPSLELADIHAVIGYYLHHRSQVEAYLTEREARAATVRRENESRFDPTGVRDRLLTRRGPEGKR